MINRKNIVGLNGTNGLFKNLAEGEIDHLNTPRQFPLTQVNGIHAYNSPQAKQQQAKQQQA
jgi:hypothetical protein